MVEDRMAVLETVRSPTAMSTCCAEASPDPDETPEPTPREPTDDSSGQRLIPDPSPVILVSSRATKSVTFRTVECRRTRQTLWTKGPLQCQSGTVRAVTLSSGANRTILL